MRKLAHKIKREIYTYRGLIADPRTPKRTRYLLGAAIAYAASPIDLIPDFIPVIGHLDDIIILPVLIWLALQSVPPELIKEHRQKIEHLQ